MNGAQTEQVVEPRTTGELFRYIGKKLPKQILKALPVTIAVAVVSWLVHTYLIVGPNGGFAPDTWLANNILNVKGKLISSTFLWALLGGVITMFVSSLIQGRNPFKSLAEMIKVPGNIIKKNKAMNNGLLPVLMIACGVSLLFEKLLSGVAGLVLGGILLSSVAAFASGTGGIFTMIFRMIFSDVQAFILKKQKFRMDNEAVYMILGASGLVFMLFGFLQATNLFMLIFGGIGGLVGRVVPFLGVAITFIGLAINFILGWVWFVLLLIGILILVTKKKPAVNTMMFFALFFLSAVAAQRLLGVSIFADDGGWEEAGGTFIQWIGSEGALIAVIRGLPPALGGIIGANLAAIFTGLGINIGGGIGGGIGAGIGAGGGIVPPDLGGGPGPDAGAGEPQVPQDPQQPQEPQEPQQPQEPDQGGQDDEQKQREEFERQARERAEIERQEAAEQHRLEMERRRQEYERQQKEKFEAARREIERIKREQEKQRQEYIDRLCKKYNTTPDKLRDTLKKNIADGQADSERWNKIEKVLWVGEKMATATVVVADTMIDGMASCGGPGAKAVRAIYKVTKGAASSAADKGFTTENVLGGAVSGGADAATDFISNPYAKAATTIVGETAAGAITGGVDGAKDGFINGVYSAGMNAATDKIAGDGFGNETKMDFHKNGTATVSVKTGSGWVDKTVSGTTAVKFHTNKVGKQVTTSAIKGTVGMGNELGAKPVLQDKGILPK